MAPLKLPVPDVKPDTFERIIEVEEIRVKHNDLGRNEQGGMKILAVTLHEVILRDRSTNAHSRSPIWNNTGASRYKLNEQK